MCNVFASCHVVVRATDKSLKKRKAEIGLRIFLKPDLSPPVLQRPPVLYFAGAPACRHLNEDPKVRRVHGILENVN